MGDRLVTLAMAVYGQPKMLEVWFDTLRSYSKPMLASMELLIVDDCGDPAAVVPDDIQALLPCHLFRVTENIPWNQPGARNLALDHCLTDLVLFVDPDMVFPLGMMTMMLDAGLALERGNVIRFQLKHRGGRNAGAIDPSSPNTWFLHAKDFLEVGGYDEDYSGHKGWSDVQLLDVMRSVYKIRHDPKLHADFYNIEEVPDAMVTTLDRSHRANKAQRLLKVKEARMMGGWPKWIQTPRKRLRFEWRKLL
jgi:hypothetical protein